MKQIKLPNITAKDAYLTCVSGVVRDHNLKERLNSAWSNVEKKTNEYEEKAKNGNLYTIPPLDSKTGDNDSVIGTNINKSEFIKLYKYYMLNEEKPARHIYDNLMLLAEGKCPFCGGIGIPRNLDHFFPNAYYPQFSILPLNLVPACRDCNMDKGSTFATVAEEQILHPYLDKDCFFNEQWVSAHVIPDDIVVIEFYVNPPDSWDSVDVKRARKHFKDFSLAERYSLQAGEELSVVIDQRKQSLNTFTQDEFREHLKMTANSTCFFINHWRRIMYQSLANDEWFCSNKF